MSAGPTLPLDREATVNLSMAMLDAIKKHYASRPISRTTVLEVLNATAAVAADVISEADHSALEFFLAAFHQNTTSAIKRRNAKTGEKP